MRAAMQRRWAWVKKAKTKKTKKPAEFSPKIFFVGKRQQIPSGVSGKEAFGMGLESSSKDSQCLDALAAVNDSALCKAPREKISKTVASSWRP